jgi:pimeloyl-ACP methyl ester carboxylesterase/predicted glycosyltransferase
MRARYPDEDGFVERDGLKIAYEVYGGGDRTIVLTPPDPIVHSRVWKGQIPYLSRYARVVAIDPVGNGRSDRTMDAVRFSDSAAVADTVAVMDGLGVDRALLVGFCTSSWRSLLMAVSHPDRVLGVASVATQAPYLTPPLPHRAAIPWDEPLDTDEGWAKENKFYWLRDYPGYCEFFFDQLLPEPHSTKQWDDAVSWSADNDPEMMVVVEEAPLATSSRDDTLALLSRVRCPVLTIHGGADVCQAAERSITVAELTGGRSVVLEGAGHLPQARYPVLVNRLLHDFLDEVAPVPPAQRSTRTMTTATRPPRALFISSPIGLGHARRDLGIARALRARRPDVEVDWLTQSPVDGFLAGYGEQVHPGCAELASESAHVEEASGEHDLHAFQALRDMDEILVHNFMVFAEIVEQGQYDLVVGDEAWDVDHFLHEHPELKRTAFAWVTDFVGFVPFPDGGDREAFLAADYNAEMVEHLARAPRVRDRSLFVGDPEDVVPHGLGPGLPSIREWTDATFDYCGYVTGFEPVPDADRAGLRAELGYRDDEQVCLVTVGGSAVGVDLLRRVVAAYSQAKAQVPGLRMVVVTGPRIDPAAVTAGLPSTVAADLGAGLQVRPYVHDLWQHLAVCDLAVVQGGLTTTMELTANRRPFLYVPLRHHFEQQFHVRHRLDRHRAGRMVDYDATTPEELAAAMAGEIGRTVDYVPVPADGADRVAARLSDLV